MRGKLRVVFLAIFIVAMAGAAQAETIIPMVVGYNATYSVTWEHVSSDPYTASMKIISGPQDIDGTNWWTMRLINWEGDDQPEKILIRATDTAVYFGDPEDLHYDPDRPHFKIGEVNSTWTNEEGNICQIISITTYAGFNNVYEMVELIADDSPEYWKPGVGFLGEIIPDYNDSDSTKTMTLTAYATPVPPSLLLLGSGLVGLLGLRRFRRQ